MFDFFGVDDWTSLAQFAVVGCFAAVAGGVLAIVRRRQEKRLGTAIVSGNFMGFEPYVGSTRRAVVRVKNAKDGSGKEVFLFSERSREIAKGARAVFLVHNGFCCAYLTEDGMVMMKNVSPRVTHLWLRCVLVPFSSFFYATVFMLLAAAGGGMGDTRLIRLWDGAWVVFTLAGYGVVIHSLLRLRTALRERFPDLRQAYSVFPLQ